MRKVCILVVLVVTICFGLSKVSEAARPLSTDDTGTVEKGEFELETGYEYVKQNTEENNFSIVLTSGVLKNMDIGIEIPYNFIEKKKSDNVDGIGDIMVCSKYRLWKETTSYPAGAVSFTVKSQTGDEDKGLGSGEVSYEVNSIFTKNFNSLVGHLNLGYTFKEEPEGKDVDDIFGYKFALVYPVNEKFNLMNEIVGETNFEGDFDDNPCEGLVGFNYAISNNVVYDFGVGYQMSKSSPDYKITTGITTTF